jgi:hypothetical protein
MKAKYKAQFCPFSGIEGFHFMKLRMVERKDEILMTRLNRYWESTEREAEILADRKKEKETEKERDRDPNVGIHGVGCSCPWPELREGSHHHSSGKHEVEYEVPLIDDNFEDSSSDDMPEIEWEEEEKDTPHMGTTTIEHLGSTNSEENKLKDNSVFPTLVESAVMDKKHIEENMNTMFVPVPITYTRTMKPHCSTPKCNRCLYKMKCFQTWASSLIVTPDTPLYRSAMPLPTHMALNL